MQVIIHAGAHETEEDRVLKTLLRNGDLAAKRGVAVPGPSKFRNLLNGCVEAVLNGGAVAQSSDVLWDAILEAEQVDRVILSNPHFFGAPRQAVEMHSFYPEAEMRMGALKTLFPQDQLELHFGVRDPASLLPALVKGTDPKRGGNLLDRCAPLSLQWSNLLMRLRTAVPDIPITVWVYEDMPMIWGQVIRGMLGVGDQERIAGGMDLLASIMSTEGMQRLRSYLHEHRDMGEAHKQRVIAAFLGKYAIDEAIEEEVDLPGWTDALMAELTRRYEADLDEIARIPGVTLLSA